MIPKKIIIKGTEYTIEVKDLIESSLGFAQGFCDKNKKYIAIDDSLDLEDTLITFIHEYG